MQKTEMKSTSMMELDSDLEMKLGFGEMLAEGASWPKLYLMVGTGDIYNHTSERVLRYVKPSSGLRDIAKRYGFYWKDVPGSITSHRVAAEYLYAKTTDGKWVPWIGIREQKKFVIYGSTCALGIWFSETRPELAGACRERLIAEINELAAKYGAQIQPYELIAKEDCDHATK